MAILYETDKLILSNEYESACLKIKSTGEILLEEVFYGDPKCGLIDDQNNWAIIAGEHLTIWTSKLSKTINDENIKWVHSLRLKNAQAVEVLIDPWCENASIWEINLITLEIKKISDFDDYKNSEYVDKIIW